MGNLIWHEWARYVSITASLYSIWAAFYGIFYRKFFWDFVGGTLRAPGGLQPSPGIAIFIGIIVKVPVIQLMTMFMGMGMVALEFPAPFLKGSSLQRNLTAKVVLLIMQAANAIMFYQGTNGAIYSLVAAIGYTRAIVLGEAMEEAKNNRGRGGKA